MEGLTGKVNFDQEGFRSNFMLDIVELRKEGLTKVILYCAVLAMTVVFFINVRFKLFPEKNLCLWTVVSLCKEK